MMVLQAQSLIESQKRVDKLKSSMYAMDHAVFAEIRRYHKPHPVVHRIICAALLLLGEHEGRTRVSKRLHRGETDVDPDNI